jgi:hypothetical protein
MLPFSIAPRWDLVFTALLSIVGFIAGGQISAPPHFDAGTWQLVKDWSIYLMGWFTALSLIFPALSSYKAGPLVSSSAPK